MLHGFVSVCVGGYSVLKIVCANSQSCQAWRSPECICGGGVFYPPPLSRINSAPPWMTDTQYAPGVKDKTCGAL